MNLSDPKLAGQVRKVTVILGALGLLMSAVALGISLYSISLHREHEAFLEVIRNPWDHPEQVQEVDCVLDGRVATMAKIICTQSGGKVIVSASNSKPVP